MSLIGDFEHHLQISVGIYIPTSWVMFNWDIYQPLIDIYIYAYTYIYIYIDNRMNQHDTWLIDTDC